MIKFSTWLRIALVPALFFAVLSGYNAPASAQFTDTWEFLKAVDEVDYLEMRTRLTKGANINAKNSDGKTALFMATEKRSAELISFLLDQGANVNLASGERDETPLMQSSKLAHLEGMQILLDAGADPNAQDRGGETALMKAAKGRRSKPVTMLLEQGANIDQADFTGRSALQYAREYRRRSLARILEKAGAR